MKVGHPPAFLFYPDDFSSDGKVEAMTTEEVGAYMLLLCKSWRESPPGSIPSDDVVLARWARLTADRWSICRAAVLAAFTFGPDSRWHQKRLRREYDKLKASRKEKQKAANIRWKKELDARALQTQCLPIPIPSPISKEKIKAEEELAAAAFSAAGFEKPFGHKPFQAIWVRHFYSRGEKDWISWTMEQAIQECQQRGIGVPPAFFDAKHDVEKAEMSAVKQRVPL